jgi:hypothetical protein
MKNNLCLSLVAAMATLFVSSEWALCADNTPPAPATPGSDQAQDSKSQQNNPPGTASQPTASIPNDSKNSQNVPAGTDPNGTVQNGAGAQPSKPAAAGGQ